MLLSDFLKGGSTLQAKAGPLAINSNDILEQNILGAVFSASCIDYANVSAAAATPIASTTINATTSVQNNQQGRNTACVLADGSILLVDNAVGGVTVWKYTATGTLIGSVSLDPLAPLSVQIVKLSNGQFAVAWVGSVNPTYLVNFAIIDQYLNTIVANTNIGGSSVNPGPNVFITALTGGGFVMTWTKAATGIYFAIRNNAGALVQAATLFAGTPAQTSGNNNGMGTSTANLSNGSIGVAFADTNTHALGYAVLTAAGAVTVAYTAIGGGTGGTIYGGPPDISVLPGFFAVCPGRGSTSSAVNAYVITNAGALSGAGFSQAQTNVYTSLINDGTYFWLVGCWGGGSGALIVRLTTAGVASAIGVSTVVTTIGTVLFDQGLLIITNGTATGNCWAFSFNGLGLPNPLPVVTTAVANTQSVTLPVGDCCLLSMGGGIWSVAKYAPTCIVGVSQSTLAAGNAGTIVSYNMGAGAYPCNPLVGSINKAFDHTAATLLGNKGIYLGAAVSLRGI